MAKIKNEQQQVATSSVGDVPQSAEVAKREASTLADPESPFQLVYVPGRWDVVFYEDGLDANGDIKHSAVVVPALVKMSYAGGVNGVVMDRETGKPILKDAIADLEEVGRIRIPFDAYGGPGTSYVWRDPASGGWYTRWERPVAGSSFVDCDTRGYASWLKSLYDGSRKSGFRLERPPAHVLQELAKRLQQQRQNNARQQKTYEVGIINVKLRAVSAMLSEYPRAEVAGETPQVAG